MSRSISVISLLLIMVLFQNFQFRSINPWKIKEFDEATRIDHAKELLGKYFDTSPVSETKGIPYFEIHILNQVQSNLPKKHKARAGKIANSIISESKRQGFDPVFVMAIILTESKFNPEAVGSVGELGLMQIRPETGEWIAKRNNIKWKGKRSLTNPVSNIRIGVGYMAFLRDHFQGKAANYLTAYNMGPAKLKRMVAAAMKPKIYSVTVMKNYFRLYQEISMFNDLKYFAVN